MMSIDDIMALNAKNEEKRKDSAMKALCDRVGYNSKGKVWLLTEELLEIDRKEEYKRLGGRYDRFLGWHSPMPIKGFKSIRSDLQDIGEYKNGKWFTLKFKADEARRKACLKKLGKRKAASGFIGELGVNHGTNARVRLVSVTETMFRDAYYDLPKYYGLPYKYEYRFVDDVGNYIAFASAYYRPELVKEWFGNGWADLTARAVKWDDSMGVKITRISYPEFSKSNKGFLKDYARIPNPYKNGVGRVDGPIEEPIEEAV